MSLSTASPPGIEAEILPDSDGAAFLFTDIEGSTRRWETAPEAMRQAMHRHDAILRATIARHRGRIFKSRGDGFGVVFPSMHQAVAATVDGQRALIAADWSDIGGLKVRMALHCGPVEPRDGDFFGPTLHRLARLLGVGHGEQILMSADALEALDGQVGGDVSLVDLGSHQLRDLIEPARIYQITAPGLPAEFGPLRSLNRALHNLPSQLTPLVGREQALAEIRPLLKRDRLVTLVGPGGIGKTRLAVQIGAELQEDFPDGVWLAEFAAISDASLLPNVIAKLFGISTDGNAPPLPAVLLTLQRRKTLLILDNCEHLTEAVAGLAETLLRQCPEVRMLVTSRERLGLIGESVFRVESLAVPPPDEALDGSAADRWASINLFADRARAVDRDFVLDEATAGPVAEICRRLDGIPLALELAAARLSVMSVSEITSGLSERFRLSTRDCRGVPPRHRTLQATMDWSYGLLSAEEQRMFRGAGVFAGTWTLDAATQVLGEAGASPWQVLDLIGALVDKSLIVAEKAGQERRFRLLETMRAYALDRLDAAGERGEAQTRHARYYLDQMTQAEARWNDLPTVAWLAVIEPQIDNIRAALEAAVGGRIDASLGYELAAATPLLWTEAALQHEGRRWLEQIGTPDEAPIRLRARLYLGRARLAPYRDVAQKLPLIEQAVALFRQTDDRVGLGDALAVAGNAMKGRASRDEPERYLAEAYALLSGPGAEKLRGRCANSLGHLKLFSNDVAAAKTFYTEALRLAEARGDAAGRISGICNLAETEFALGEYARAIEQCRTYIEICRAERRIHRLANGLANLAAYLLAVDDPIEARAAARESLIRAQETQSRFLVAISIEHLAIAGAVLGERKLAARLAGFSDAHYRRNGTNREPTEQLGHRRLIALLEATYEPVEIERLMAEGAALDERTAIDEALCI
ncbi:MAG TPA: adenylate/guanylate cyclase domain-containing protein [Aliidongia sp.]|nr:adenylate/guanylate cyclase domain-containing protein [Aliidongia sp.]